MSASGYNGGKAWRAGAVAHHIKIQPQGNFLFRNAGTDLAENIRQRLFCDPLGLDHTFQLRLVLDGPQRPQKLRGGDQLAAELLRKAVKIRRL